MTEDEYCGLFAGALESDEPFRHWVLTRTKFFTRRRSTILVAEQAMRPAKHWWRHWWTQLPDGSQSETDIFAVFADPTDEHRFALHFECKLDTGKFLPNQPAQYALRGEFMKQNKWAPYADFDTVLIAPTIFLERYAGDVGAFGVVISFEEIACWLADFRA